MVSGIERMLGSQKKRIIQFFHRKFYQHLHRKSRGFAVKWNLIWSTLDYIQIQTMEPATGIEPATCGLRTEDKPAPFQYIKHLGVQVAAESSR